MAFTVQFYQTYKELIPILLKLFQKTEEKGTLPNSFCENTITIISKPDKHATKKKATQVSTFKEQLMLYELYLNLKNRGQFRVNEREMYVCLSDSEVEGRCMYSKPGQPAQISVKIQLKGT